MEYDYGEDLDLTVTIEDEDGNETDCDVILIFELEDQDYVALTPSSGEPDEIYLFRCNYDGGDTMEIESIEDEDEFNDVQETFEYIMEQEEWNDMMYDDEN